MPRLCVLVRSLAQVEAAARSHNEGAAPIAMLWCDLPAHDAQREAVVMARAANLPVGLATTAVLMPGEEAGLRAILDARPDAALVRNLAAARILREEAPGLPLVGDYHLNVANELSAAALLRIGLSRVTAGLDLDAERLAAMLARLPAARVEVPLRLRVPMFYTAHCLWAANLTKSRSCAECASPRADNDLRGSPKERASHATAVCAAAAPPCRHVPLRLRDRVGEEHVVLADAAGRNTVFASRERSFARAVPRLLRAGARWFRVELVDETGEETHRVIEDAARAIQPPAPGGGLQTECRMTNTE